MSNHSTSLEFSHFPVMLNEVLKISSLANGGKVIDCTFGGGGYSKEILKLSNTNVQAIDRDEKAISIANKLEKNFLKGLNFIKQNLANLKVFLMITLM